MDEYHESIVFRSEVVEDKGSLSVATDDSALVKAYGEALKTFRSCNDEKESKEKLGNNPSKLTDSKLPKSYVLSKEPVDSKWEVGSHCKAVWSEDGLVYPATLVWLEGERCKVKFDNYGNEEELNQSSLLPEASDQPRREKRAVDGFRSTSNNNADWKRKEREWRTPQQEGREKLSSPQPPKFPPGKAYAKSSYDFGKEHGDKKKPSSWREEPSRWREEPSSFREEPSGQREEPNNHPFSFFPPVPPPKDSLVSLPILPPPPPPPCVWPPRAVLTGDGLDSAVTDLSSMLLSWYLCGYHTGCSMAMQQTKASRKRADKEKQAEE